MAVVFPDSFANLQTAVANELNRQDLTDNLPVFIRMAETLLERQLRCPDMINRAYATASTPTIPVPSDFLEMSLMTYLTPPYGGAMEYISPEDFKRKQFENYTGKTRYFTVIGQQIDLLPEPSAGAPATLEMVYYKTIPRLSASQTTNWLLVKHPDLYLYATLMQSAPYLIEDDRINLWSTMVQGIVSNINQSGENAVRPRTKLLARPNKPY